MKQKTNKMLIFTSLAAYFTYFIHGIGASILGQYKPEFAACLGVRSPWADWHPGCKYGSICNCSTWTGASDFSSFLRSSV